MTAYSPSDLEGWEFKIVRANTRKFKDREAVRKWHGRLRAKFPEWTKSPAETAEFVARALGVSLPQVPREE